MSGDYDENFEINRDNIFIDVLFVVAQAGYAKETLAGPYLCKAMRDQETYWSAMVKLRGKYTRANALLSAIEANSLSRVEWLLRCGAQIDGPTLHIACSKGYTEVASLLLDYGANIESTDYFYSRRPLWVAIFDKNYETARLLIERGANIHIIEPLNKMSYFDTACSSGNVNIVKLLLDMGFSVEATTSVPPIYGATAKGHLEVVRLLLDRGANINARTASGFTALRYASHSCPMLTQFLLDRGATK